MGHAGSAGGAEIALQRSMRWVWVDRYRGWSGERGAAETARPPERAGPDSREEVSAWRWSVLAEKGTRGGAPNVGARYFSNLKRVPARASRQCSNAPSWVVPKGHHVAAGAADVQETQAREKRGTKRVNAARPATDAARPPMPGGAARRERCQNRVRKEEGAFVRGERCRGGLCNGGGGARAGGTAPPCFIWSSEHLFIDAPRPQQIIAGIQAEGWIRWAARQRGREAEVGRN